MTRLDGLVLFIAYSIAILGGLLVLAALVAVVVLFLIAAVQWL